MKEKPMRNTHIEVKPIAGTVGAEIYGVDISTNLPDTAIAEIRQALNTHGVIFFHDQTINVAQHKAFTRRFGDIFIHPNYFGVVPDPEILDIVRNPGDVHIVGEEWHADTTMTAEPPMAAILYAIETPPYGGDTMFASQCAAYDALSDGLKQTLAGMRAIHSDRKVAGPRAGKDLNNTRSTKVRDGADWQETINAHPVVRTHPENGRKLLNVNASYTIGFEGWTEAESQPLLNYLLEHGNRPEFTCRFRYRNGSVAFWDNRAVKHIALHDTGPFRRVMRRTQIAGSRPY